MVDTMQFPHLEVVWNQMITLIFHPMETNMEIMQDNIRILILILADMTMILL